MFTKECDFCRRGVTKHRPSQRSPEIPRVGAWQKPNSPKALGQIGRITGKTGQLKTRGSYGESRAEATLERVIWRELSA